MDLQTRFEHGLAVHERERIPKRALLKKSKNTKRGLRMNKVLIDASESLPDGSGTMVFIDGKQIQNVLSVTNEYKVGRGSVVRLEFMANTEILPPMEDER